MIVLTANEVSVERLEDNLPRLFGLLAPLYGSHDDFSNDLDNLLLAAAQSWRARSTELEALDREREDHPACLHEG